MAERLATVQRDPFLKDQRQLEKALERARVGEDKELLAGVREDGERLARLIGGLMRLGKVHARENKAFDQPVSEVVEILRRLLDALGRVELVCVEDQVYVNEIRLRLDERGDAEVTLGPDLRRYGVGGLTFHALPGDGDLRVLAALLSSRPDPEHPRGALVAALNAKKIDSIALLGQHRFRMSDEETRDGGDDKTAALGERATSLIDSTCAALTANRLPNSLPLRRMVLEMLGQDPEVEEEEVPASPESRHMLRVSRLALVLGKAAGLSEGELQDLGVAAMMHDVGYAAREGASGSHPGYPPPFSRHGTAGARMVLRQKGFHEAKIKRALAILDHHADFSADSGPPSLFARILRIVEDFDTFIRPNGANLSPADALIRMAGGAGDAYDPILLQLFVNALGRYPPGTRLRLADGRTVQSISMVRSPETFAKPRTRVLSGPGGAQASGEVDLAVEGKVAKALAGGGRA